MTRDVQPSILEMDQVLVNMVESGAQLEAGHGRSGLRVSGQNSTYGVKH